MSAATSGVVLLLVALQAWLIPVAISRLPEPPPERPGSTSEGEETPLQRVLREEGPKELYVAVARIAHLAPVCSAVSVLLAVGVLLSLGSHPVAWVVSLLTPTLVLLAVVDWRTRLLPRVVVLPATGALLALVVLEWASTGQTHLLVRSLVAMVLARSFFWLLWAIRRAGMGFGDVRLAALIGVVLGRVSWNAWILGLYGGLLLFSAYGIGLTVIRRDVRTLKRHLPYGPFMVLGMYAGIFLGAVVHVV